MICFLSGFNLLLLNWEKWHCSLCNFAGPPLCSSIRRNKESIGIIPQYLLCVAFRLFHFQKRREAKAVDSTGLEEADRELLENNKNERSHMEDEIKELRDRNVTTLTRARESYS